VNKPLVLIVCVLGALWRPVWASPIVSIDRVDFDTIPAGWSGVGELSLSGASGNSDFHYASAALSVQHKKNQQINLISMAHHQGESQGEKNRDHQFVHVRHSQFFRPKLAWEAFVQYQSDQFKQLESRYLMGAGVRIDRPLARGFSSYGLALMGERERLDSGEVRELARLSGVAKHELTLSDSARLTNSFYLQPEVGEWANYRLTNQFKLSSVVTEKLSIELKLTGLYASEPPLGVEKTDWIYSTGLKVTF